MGRASSSRSCTVQQLGRVLSLCLVATRGNSAAGRRLSNNSRLRASPLSPTCAPRRHCSPYVCADEEGGVAEVVAAQQSTMGSKCH